MKKLLAILIVLTSLSSCNKEPENLMSPCVGKAGSPCDRTPVNHFIPVNVKV